MSACCLLCIAFLMPLGVLDTSQLQQHGSAFPKRCQHSEQRKCRLLSSFSSPCCWFAVAFCFFVACLLFAYCLVIGLFWLASCLLLAAVPCFLCPFCQELRTSNLKSSALSKSGQESKGQLQTARCCSKRCTRSSAKKLCSCHHAFPFLGVCCCLFPAAVSGLLPLLAKAPNVFLQILGSCSKWHEGNLQQQRIITRSQDHTAMPADLFENCFTCIYATSWTLFCCTQRKLHVIDSSFCQEIACLATQVSNNCCVRSTSLPVQDLCIRTYLSCHKMSIREMHSVNMSIPSIFMLQDEHKTHFMCEHFPCDDIRSCCQLPASKGSAVHHVRSLQPI